MILFSARGLLSSGTALEILRSQAQTKSLVVDPDQPIFNPSTPIDEYIRNKALTAYAQVEKDCEVLQLKLAQETCADLHRRLSNPSFRANCQWVQDSTRSLQSLMGKELAERISLYIPAGEDAVLKRDESPNLFGLDVASNFPSAGNDIFESGMYGISSPNGVRLPSHEGPRSLAGILSRTICYNPS